VRRITDEIVYDDDPRAFDAVIELRGGRLAAEKYGRGPRSAPDEVSAIGCECPE
jgi:hypothetical protein